MDAFELLKNDHEKVAQLFKEIESASGQAKLQVFARLKSELDVHAHIEEKVLYPALENTEEAREITLESYEEHKVVKDLLAELAGGGAPNDEWDAKLTVLKENVEHHVEEEESELFSKARKALSSEELDRIGVELEAEKARLQDNSVKAKGVSQSAKRQPAKATTRPSQKGSSRSSKQAESPGVLRRIANLIGLGDNSAASTKTAKKASKTWTANTSKAAPSKRAGGNQASETSKASKGQSAKPGPRSTRRPAAKKSAAKAPVSRKKAASKPRATEKRSAAGIANKRAPSGKRAKASQTASSRSASSRRNTSRTSTRRSKAS